MKVQATRAPLYGIQDLEGESPPGVQEHRQIIDQVLDWVENYLCRSHPRLGRKGPVCPYVGTSLEKRLFFFSVLAGIGDDVGIIKKTALDFRDRFEAMEPRRGEDAQFKTILMIFPAISKGKAPKLIDRAQVELAPQFAPRGLMIGEFHAGPPQKPGLWNPSFRPLFCPVSMLVIRHMVSTDLLFLKGEKLLLKAYFKNFGDQIPPRWWDMAKEAAQSLGLPVPASPPQAP